MSDDDTTPRDVFREDGVLRELKAVTSDDVPAVLHEALSLAVQSKLRGVVVLMAYHGSPKLRHLSGGTINLGEVALMVDHWKWQHFDAEHKGR